MNKLFVVCIVMMCSTITLLGQSGMEFAEFSKKLEAYYEKELIGDVKQQLPQGAEFRIWGWDVGDFSGDGYNDIACTIRLNNDKQRNVTVYLFVDVDGYLQEVRRFQYTFVDIPLEVGVAIKNNACYITQKHKQYNWTIKGYRFESGSIILLDEFNTARIDKFTKEVYRNFVTLQYQQRFISTIRDEVVFENLHTVLPCYQRGEQVYKGYSATADIKSVHNVSSGSFWWSGATDCSFQARTAYDNEFLYFNLTVLDDTVITARCDSCPADYVEIWFDTKTPDKDGERYYILNKSKKHTFRTAADSGVYKVRVNLGDFLERRPTVQVSSTEADDQEVQQKIALQQITKKVSPTRNGYTIKMRIPFSLLGFEKAPTSDKVLNDIGCSVVVHDIENEYRPEEETLLASSNFVPMNPSSFGTLVLVPSDQFYGDAENIFSENLIQFLNDLGF